MPYLNSTLVPDGELLTNYSLLTTSEMPNYIAMVRAGRAERADEGGLSQVQQEFPSNPKYDKYWGGSKETNCVYPAGRSRSADQLASGGFTWRAYMEGMADDSGPHNWVHPDTGAGYDRADGATTRTSTRSDFHSLLDLGSCALNDVLAHRAPDRPRGEVDHAQLLVDRRTCATWVFRDRCPGNGPDGAAAADEWLSQIVPEIHTLPAYKKDGVIIISFGQVAAGQQAEELLSGSEAGRDGPALAVHHRRRDGFERLHPRFAHADDG